MPRFLMANRTSDHRRYAVLVNVSRIALAVPVGDGVMESRITLSDGKFLDVDVPFPELARFLRQTEH
jgi:hypothetical protein